MVAEWNQLKSIWSQFDSSADKPVAKSHCCPVAVCVFHSEVLLPGLSVSLPSHWSSGTRGEPGRPAAPDVATSVPLLSVPDDFLDKHSLPIRPETSEVGGSRHCAGVRAAPLGSGEFETLGVGLNGSESGDGGWLQKDSYCRMLLRVL